MEKVYLVYIYWYNVDGFLEPTLDCVYKTEELAQQAVEQLKDGTEGGNFEPFYEEVEVKDEL